MPPQKWTHTSRITPCKSTISSVSFHQVRHAPHAWVVVAPAEIAFVKQEACMGYVKWDLHQLYLHYKTDNCPVVAFKGSTLELILLTEMKLPHLDVEAWGCPELKDMMRLAAVESCKHHQDSCHHQFSHIKCYHFVNWLRTRLGLDQDLCM